MREPRDELAAIPIRFTAVDAIDILATSVLTYYLLLLIRGTRAVQIMLGLFVLVVILAVSNLLHLLVLATVMQYLLLGTAVGLPIVFQPELRRGLEQLGRGRLFVRDRRAEDEIAAEQIRIVVARRASRSRAQRIGALIVIEQQTGLREYVESGTALDARLSRRPAARDLQQDLAAARRRGDRARPDRSKARAVFCRSATTRSRSTATSARAIAPRSG